MKKRMLVALLLMPLVLHPLSPICAQTREIVSEGTYIMGDGETPIVAEGRALEQAKRSAVEQAGTYLQSYSLVKNFQIERDEVEVLASGALEITILDKKRTLEADAVKFWVKIRAIVTPDRIDVILERIRDNALVQEYEQMKAAYVRSREELARLKEQLAQEKISTGKKELIARITDQEKEFQASQLYTDALGDFAAGRMGEALDRLTRAVKDSPSFYQAYLLRGFVHLKQEEFDRAIADMDRVIAMKHDAAKAYAGRGICYSNQKRFKAAIADLDRALELNPGFSRELEGVIHGHLGRSLFAEGQYRKAKDHLLMACKNGDKPYCRALRSPKLINLR